MARPMKEGLDYFPLDVDIDQDEKVGLVEAAHGTKGFAIVVKLLMKIYKNSYFFEWGEREQLLFTRGVDADITEVNAVINTCVKWGFFDKDLFEKANILTSHGIQIRYLEASRRRNQARFYKEYSLLSKLEINEYNNLVFVNINSENDEINLQSKLDESIVDESKLDESKQNKRIEDLTNNVTEIYNHYLSKNIIKHQKLNDGIKTAITARLRDYSVEELIKAIDNYAFIFFSDLHYYNHKLPLINLLEASKLSNFLDEADPINNFKVKTKNVEKEADNLNGKQTDNDGEYNYDRELPLDF